MTRRLRARRGLALRGSQRVSSLLLSHSTFNAFNPRNPRFDRHSNGSGTSVTFGQRRKNASSTICPSIRASGAPKQKCAAYPNAR